MTFEDDIGVTMKGQESGKRQNQQGYVMAALLVSLAVMSVLMAVAMPSWRHMAQREREAELVFRGEQYARAVGLFQRKFAGAFPPSIDVLLEQKFLRKKYKDPMVPDGEFQVLYQTSAAQRPGAVSSRPGTPAESDSGPDTPQASPTPGVTAPGGQPPPAGARGGVLGVVSKSTKNSIRLYHGRSRYNEWQFVYTDVTTQGGSTPGGSAPPGSVEGQPGASRPGTLGGPRPSGERPGLRAPRSPTRPPG
jgi:type II secretory pathway pseudopilin PulG